MWTRRDVLRTGALGAALAAGFAVTGCESAVNRAERDASGSGAAGGTLVIGSLTDVDPKTIYSQSITSMTIGLLLWDTLIRYDHATLEPKPSVASSWETSADGRSLRLNLRDDVYFHSGRRLDSGDVAYSIAKYASKDAGSQLQATATAVASVDTADPHVAVLHFSRPVVNIFDLLEFMLLTDRETESELARGESFVGTGPFRFARRTTGAQFELVGNERYWNGPPRLDAVTVRVVRDQGALLTSVRANQSDIVFDASPQQLRPFTDTSLYRVESFDVDDVAYYVGANVADPRLADARVRQAISYAVDRDRIAAEVFAGRAAASSAPWAQSSPAFSPGARVRYRRDLDRARSLLADAGFDAGGPLLLSYGSGLAPARLISAIVAYNLSEVGIDVQLDPREQAAYNPFLKSGRHQLWISPHGFGQSNPATLANGAAPFKPKGNLSQFSSPDYTAAVAAFDTISDPRAASSKAVYQRFTDELLDQQFIINLVITSWTNVSRARVSGVASNLYKYVDLHGTTVQ